MAKRSSSKSSVSSAKSGKTSASPASVAALARAKAEAAKVRAAYASQEAKLKMEKATREAEILTRDAQNQLEKARIDTQLEMLNLQREADAAVAEAEVETGQSVSEQVKVERTSQYVQSQLNLQKQSPSPHLPAGVPSQVESHGSFVMSCVRADEVSPLPPTCKLKGGSGASLPDPLKDEKKTRNSTIDVRAQPYAHQYIPSASTPFGAKPVAQHLARRDLVNSGLYQFDDKPENYRAWYSSFTSAAGGLQLTATQELDLMTKWLGRDSSELVKTNPLSPC